MAFFAGPCLPQVLRLVFHPGPVFISDSVEYGMKDLGQIPLPIILHFHPSWD